MATTTYLLVIRGDTRPAKEVLKKAGWTWNPQAQHWFMRLVPAHAERVSAGDTEFMYKSLYINRKGCQVTLDGVVVWTSKTFAAAPGQPAKLANADQDGFGWNADAAGNNAAGQVIPGSSPDDRI